MFAVVATPATPSGRRRGDAGVAATLILDYIFRMTLTPLLILSLLLLGNAIGIVSGMIRPGDGGAEDLYADRRICRHILDHALSRSPLGEDAVLGEHLSGEAEVADDARL